VCSTTRPGDAANRVHANYEHQSGSATSSATASRSARRHRTATTRRSRSTRPRPATPRSAPERRGAPGCVVEAFAKSLRSATGVIQRVKAT
jgi:hypothetical protein